LNGLDALDEIGAFARSSRATIRNVVGVIGVFDGIKPATIVDRELVALCREGEFSELIKSLELEIIDFDDVGTGIHRAAISRHRNLAEELSRVFQHTGSDNPEYEYPIGALLGYPVTATDYYLQRNQKLKEILKKIEEQSENALSADERALVSEENYPPVNHGRNPMYVQFILSPENWQTEVACSDRIEEAVRVLTPKTHERISKLDSVK